MFEVMLAAIPLVTDGANFITPVMTCLTYITNEDGDPF